MDESESNPTMAVKNNYINSTEIDILCWWSVQMEESEVNRGCFITRQKFIAACLNLVFFFNLIISLQHQLSKLNHPNPTTW